MKLSMAFKLFAVFVLASEAAWLRASSAPDRHHALVASENKPQTATGAARNKPVQTLYFVKHTFKNPDVDSKAYWKEAAARDYAQWFKDLKKEGMHFHSFFPIDAKGPFYCVWEAAPGKSKSSVQSFMDTSDASPTKRTESHSKAESTLYVIKHTFKNPRVDSAAYWKEAMARDWAKWYVDQSKEGFYNHMFLPTGPAGPFYCIWEAKAGKTKKDMQNWIDNDDTSPVKKTGTTNDVEQVNKALLHGHQPVQPHSFA